MDNYYDFLEIDMNASPDDIRKAIEFKAGLDDIDQQKLSELKVILLNENTKKVYDERLVNSILDKGKSGTSFNTGGLKDLLTIDNAVLHDKYIWIAIVLFMFDVLSGFIVGFNVSMTINVIIIIAILVVLKVDWDLLNQHGKATFSKWWILFSPGYVHKRCKAIGKGMRLSLVFDGIIALYVVISVVFSGGTKMLESSACDTVTRIYQDQLHQASMVCQNVTITKNNGKEHEGFAEMSDGSVKDISVTETYDNHIYVSIE